MRFPVENYSNKVISSEVLEIVWHYHDYCHYIISFSRICAQEMADVVVRGERYTEREADIISKESLNSYCMSLPAGGHTPSRSTQSH